MPSPGTATRLKALFGYLNTTAKGYLAIPDGVGMPVAPMEDE